VYACVCVHVCVWTRIKRNGNLDRPTLEARLWKRTRRWRLRNICCLDDNSPTLLPDSRCRLLERSNHPPVYLVQLDQGSNRRSTPVTAGRSKDYDTPHTPSKPIWLNSCETILARQVGSGLVTNHIATSEDKKPALGTVETWWAPVVLEAEFNPGRSPRILRITI
jgi:hypothetical protein